MWSAKAVRCHHQLAAEIEQRLAAQERALAATEAAETGRPELAALEEAAAAAAAERTSADALRKRLEAELASAEEALTTARAGEQAQAKRAAGEAAVAREALTELALSAAREREGSQRAAAESEQAMRACAERDALGDAHSVLVEKVKRQRSVEGELEKLRLEVQSAERSELLYASKLQRAEDRLEAVYWSERERLDQERLWRSEHAEARLGYPGSQGNSQLFGSSLAGSLCSAQRAEERCERRSASLLATAPSIVGSDLPLGCQGWPKGDKEKERRWARNHIRRVATPEWRF